MSNVKTRIKWIDFARALAICFVVLCHATEGAYTLKQDEVMALSIKSRVFCFTSFTFGRIGVPLFLMISGCLLLIRDYNDESIKQFWKKKWLHLLICTLAWYVIYEIFLCCYQHEPTSVIQLIDDLLFFRKLKMSHVWYMPMILGFYILLPFVADVLKNHDNRIFIFPLIIYTFTSFGFSTIEAIHKCCFPDIQLSNQFQAGFSGGNYGLIILYGYFIYEGAFDKIKKWFIIAVSSISFAAVVAMQLWVYQQGKEYNVWYTNIFLLFASMGIFELCRRMKHFYGFGIIKAISKYSFPIYLIHNIVREIFRYRIKELAIGDPIKVLLLWVICFSISFVAAWLISKIPKFGKYILFM